MKFNCGKPGYIKAYEKRQHLEKWHKHFCWLPTTVSSNADHTRNCIWLGWCERVGVYYEYAGEWVWEYRELKEV